MRLDIRRTEWDKYYYKSEQKEGQIKILNETPDQEIEKVSIVLGEMVDYGLIPSASYDLDRFALFRKAVKDNFFIFWTAINPPMERLLYALSSILKPKNILGLGIFTGNPVVWSMGPALDGTYTPEKLVAVEIDANNARLCQDNFDALCSEMDAGDVVVKVHPEDGFEVLKRYNDAEVDLLYLDANGTDPETGKERTKRINYSFLKKAYPKMRPGAYAMCHNATMDSFKEEAGDYLEFAEDDTYFSKTSGVYIDEMGLEVTRKKE
ncbi:MAG: O-methyltransferase [Promethearchaeota archaeon]